MSNYLALRSSAAPTLTVSTLLAKSITFQSTMISLGQSTNQTYRNFTNGAYTNTLWGSTLGTSNVLSTVNDVIVSQSGQYQYALQGSQSSIATNQVSRSIDSGITWQTLNNTGLPVTTYAYQSATSGFPSYTNMTTSATGQYALTSVRGGQLYVSNNANSDTPVFTPANVGGYPYIYMPFENSAADRMGNSVVTATGSVAFNVPGKVGTNAMNLVNTAGSSANNYVRATWTGASNFTFSGWFNAQTINGTQQMIYSAYQAAFMLLINTSNQLVAYTPSGGAASAIIIGTTSFTITANTWYSFTTIYQTSGICSFYVNNSLIGTATNVGGTGTLTSTQFSLGTYDTSFANAFNGYIDDFEIYHFAAPNVVNPVIYLPMEGATTDMMSTSTVTPSGSPGYVSGVVGSQALNLMNTLGPSTSAPAIQYIRASWSGSAKWTVSFWFNMQSYSTGQSQSTLFSSYEDTLLIMIYNNSLGLYTNSGTQIATSTQPAMNTWHYVTYIHQNNGLCSLYLNNSLVGTYNNPSALGTATRFSLGTYNAVALYPFNGYIDDFRIYNYVIAYSPINPMNWSQTAVSPTGQYMLAACASGGVFQSSNFGASWSQLTTSQITSLVSPGQAAMTINGPTVTPNLTGLAAFTWTKGGINWRASASTTLTGGIYEAYSMFDNNYSNRWVALSTSYSTAGNSSGISNTIIGVGTVTGDWLQIQNSVPLVMSSYQFATGYFTSRFPKTYYITGSNDGSNWYPLQYVSGGTVTTTASTTLVPSVIFINLTSTQTFGSSTVATTAYSTSTNAYTYFRLVCLTSYSGSADYLDIGEWIPYFTLPMPLYVAPSSMVVAPQLTGLASSGTALTASWTAGGVNWVANSSTVLNSSTPLSNVFNNTSNTSWAPSSQTYGSSGNASGQNTMIQIIGSIQGEWVQIQSSIPLVLSSYQFATGGTVAQLPKTYYIVGSTDGSTWFPIQFGSGGAVTTTAASTTVPGIITVYSTGTPLAQTFGSSTITTTAYSTAANAYTYFRLIGTSVYAASGAVIEIGEWYIAFSVPAPSNTSLLTVTPQQTGLAAANWTTANGVSWVASASTTLAGSFAPYAGFNNNSGINTWASAANYSVSGVYNNTYSTTVVSAGTIYGDWLQIQTSVPLIINSYYFGVGGRTSFPKTYYIVGSTDGINWFPIQNSSQSSTATPFSDNTLTNTITANITATQTIITSVTITTISSVYSSNAYTYFRIISQSLYNPCSTVAEFAEWYPIFTAATPNPVNTLAISNTNMMVSATGATAPNLTGLASNSWTVNGVNWTSSASSVNGGWSIFRGFNNTTGEGWLSDNVTQRYTNGVVNANAATTTIQTIGSTAGEWLQIQSSVPVIMNSYAFGIGPNAYPFSNTPKTYYIVASNDGTTWYPIHYGNLTVSAFTSSSSYININTTGTQPLVGNMVGSIATTAYSYSTNAYTYFRLIGTSLLYTAGGGSYMEVGEWFINFQSGSNYISTNNGSTWTTALTAPAPLLATAGSYVLTGINQTAYLYSNGITGAYTTPTLTGINANIVSAAMSATSQYMVIVTLGTTNNVFYSINYGVSWTALTIGNSAMTSCAMSADGSYLTVSSATQVFTLNRNTQGFSITLGNQAGLINQALNTVAIGNQAGQTNQSANSIVLNASTAAVNAYSQGFYVAPIALSGSSSMSSFSVLGYGADNQIVQSSSFFIGANGNVGIGTANPGSLLNVYGMMPRLQIIDVTSNRQPSIEFLRGQTSFDGNPSYSNWRIVASGGQPDGAMPALAGGALGFYHTGGGLAGHRLVLSDLGNVGIGITNPTYALHVVGGIYATGDIAALSDQRYKQNIVRLDRSLENVLQLSGYSYTREDYRPGEKQIGLLAQEVSTVFPEAVQYDKANDKYGVNYNCLIAPLVESIKSLHERINTQDQIIAQLVDRLGSL